MSVRLLCTTKRVQPHSTSWLFLIQFNVPFQDYFSSYETGQSVGGAKTEEPREKPPFTPSSRTWLVSHVARAGPNFLCYYSYINRSKIKRLQTVHVSNFLFIKIGLVKSVQICKYPIELSANSRSILVIITYETNRYVLNVCNGPIYMDVREMNLLSSFISLTVCLRKHFPLKFY